MSFTSENGEGSNNGTKTNHPLRPDPEDEAMVLDALRKFVPNDSDIEEGDDLDAPCVYVDEHLIDDEIRENRKLYGLLPAMARHYEKEATRAIERGDFDYFDWSYELDYIPWEWCMKRQEEEAAKQSSSSLHLEAAKQSSSSLHLEAAKQSSSSLHLPPSSSWKENRGWKDKQMISRDVQTDNIISRRFSSLSSMNGENIFRRAESSRPAKFCCSSKKCMFRISSKWENY